MGIQRSNSTLNIIFACSLHSTSIGMLLITTVKSPLISLKFKNKSKNRPPCSLCYVFLGFAIFCGGSYLPSVGPLNKAPPGNCLYTSEHFGMPGLRIRPRGAFRFVESESPVENIQCWQPDRHTGRQKDRDT